MRKLLISLPLLFAIGIIAACAPQTREGAETASAPRIIPEFSITADDLAIFASELENRETAESILMHPAEFLLLMRDLLKEPKDLFLLADKEHFLGEDYAPTDLLPLTDFPLALNRNDLRLRAPVMPDLLAMDQAAKNAGLRLVYSSSYRSYGYQKTVYARNVAQMGQQEADRVSARPGTSQHQLGTTVDFGSITDAFAATPEGKWLKKHAWEYGFTLSYPQGYEEMTGYSWESWHYRYIGRPGAEMTQKFFSTLQYRFLNFLDRYRSYFEERQLP